MLSDADAKSRQMKGQGVGTGDPEIQNAQQGMKNLVFKSVSYICKLIPHSAIIQL